MLAQRTVNARGSCLRRVVDSTLNCYAGAPLRGQDFCNYRGPGAQR
jgi:hypothetical protein